MSKKMLVNATQPEENRVAIVVDGILTELDIEVVGREQTKGNIYKATVVRVEQGLQAAFVDYGAERLGFLQMGEIHPSLFKAADPDGSRKGKLRINDVLRRGQELLVQVVKGQRGTKGAALTTHLSLAGRYMVLMPESDSKGVSRKIEDDSIRKKLKSTMNSLDLPENMGYIVRTAGIDQSKEELKRDFDYLVRVYENILVLAKKAKAPALIYKESNLVIRSIRDYFTADIDEVLVDDPKVSQEAKDFFAQVMPECVSLVKLHQEKRPIFSRYQIEEQIETISKNKVPLPSGGSIVIDRTEALVAIDVNSGKLAGEQGIEATALKTNLEAAVEAARQLRLRDLGGLIVIDFIDMRERKHNREVEKQLKDALKHDKAKVSIGKISTFGLLEMSRQRIKDALAEGTFLVCPHCEGTGRVKSAEAQAAALLRRIQTGIAKGQIARVEAEVPVDAALYLLNAKREELLDLERRTNIEIHVQGRSDLIAGQIEITFVRREKEDDLYLPPVTAVPEPVEFKTVQPAESIAKVEAATAPPVEAPPIETKKKRTRKKKEETEAAASAALPAEPQAVMDEVAAAPLPATTPSEDAARLFGDLIAESDDEEAPLSSGEGGKKKRKRRRKKKKGTAQATTEGTELAPETAAEESGEEEAEEGQPEEDAAGLVASEGETAKKRKRKRRRKKKTATPEEGVTAEETAGDAGVAAEEEGEEDIEVTFVTEEATAQIPGEAEESASKKKRKRKRKKKAAVATPPAAGVKIPELAAELIASLQPEPVAASAVVEPIAAEPVEVKPARKGRKPKVAAAEELPVEEPAKPKRTRKKKEVTEAAVSAALPAEAQEPDATEPPPEQPAAKKGRAKKATATSVAPASEDAPSPRKRTRKAKPEPTE